jgi:hypothetical protein
MVNDPFDYDPVPFQSAGKIKVRYKMGECFAISGSIGFPSKDPDWNFSAVRRRRLLDRVARTAMFAVGL